MKDIVVVDASTGEELPGIPTPTLIQQGVADAFQTGTLPDGKAVSGSVWYAKDTDRGYTSDEYRRVRVITKERTY